MINARYDWHFPEVKNGAAVKNLMENANHNEHLSCSYPPLKMCAT